MIMPTNKLHPALIGLCLVAVARGAVLNVKTLGSQRFTVEVNDAATVGELQEKIVSDHLQGRTITQLILKRRKLDITQKIADLNLEPNDEILCLSKKTRGKTSSAAKLAEAQERPKQRAIKREDTERLMKKFHQPQPVVEMCLLAAYGDPALAEKYLVGGGIPADRAAALQKEGKLAMQPQNNFEALLGNKASLAKVMSDPKLQALCLHELQRENPELHRQFMEDPDKVGGTDEFEKAIFSILYGLNKSSPPRPVRRQYKAPSPEQQRKDRENIKKLMELFPGTRKQVSTIYLRNCGSDFDKATAILENLMRQAAAQVAGTVPTGPASPRGAAGAEQQLPRASPRAAAKPETDSVLTITPDMLFE